MGATRSTKAVDVARYFVLLAAAEEEEEGLTPMRVQKLVYYAQGWALGLRGKPLFNDAIEAWAYGPVVKSVYQTFKAYGRAPIPASEGSDASLSESQKDHVRAVWDAYRRYSAIALSEMTHSERPWQVARRGVKASEQSTNPIALEDMRAYFSELAKQK